MTTTHAVRPPLEPGSPPTLSMRRLRQPRLAALTLALVVAGIAAGVTVALRPPGGPSPAGPLRNHGVQSGSAVGALVVPPNAYERQWRSWIRSQASAPVARRSVVSRLRREVVVAAEASGAGLIRLRVWDTTSPPSVELVVATAVRPAVYLRHRLEALLGVLGHGYRYVEAVDRHGRAIFEWSTRVRAGSSEGMLGVPRALQGCSPVASWGDPPPPCPVK